MHIPLMIAVLAILALMLLPQLDRYSNTRAGVPSLQSYLSRLAHWINA